MATVIGGNSTGTLDSSLYLLNRNDTTGAGSAGHGEQVYINISNGDLVLGHVDAFLPSETNSFLSLRTYNSQGQFNTALGPHWTVSAFAFLSQVTSAQATLVNADGSQFNFVFDSTAGLYPSVDRAGPPEA